MPDSHCPTKTLSEPEHGEIWSDQPDVPAVYSFSRTATTSESPQQAEKKKVGLP